MTALDSTRSTRSTRIATLIANEPGGLRRLATRLHSVTGQKVSISTLSRISNGKECDVKVLCTLADYFRVSVGSLFQGTTGLPTTADAINADTTLAPLDRATPFFLYSRLTQPSGDDLGKDHA